MSAPGGIAIAQATPAKGAPAVCIVGPLPPPSGGMAVQCGQLARRLQGEELSVALVRTNADYRPAWVGRIPLLRAGFRLLPYLLRLWRAAGKADIFHVFANSGWAWHLFAAPAVWIAHVRGVPVIVDYHGGNAAVFLESAPRHVFAALRAATVCVTPSAFLQRVFARHGIVATVVPNFVDLSRFVPVPPRSADGAPHVIVTRNLEAVYDIPTAVRAFAAVRRAVPGARLTIAGSGPERENVERLIDELGLRAAIHLPGRIDNRELPALYASADCMLNPSTVDNMPISVLEAFACGVPVVSTDAGGVPDLVKDGVSGLLVPVGDAERMAAQALRVLTQPALAASLRAAGLREAAAYAWPRVRDQWLDLYRRASRQREVAR